jgi:hypothetical protein
LQRAFSSDDYVIFSVCHSTFKYCDHSSDDVGLFRSSCGGLALRHLQYLCACRCDGHQDHILPALCSFTSRAFDRALGFEFVNGFHDTANAVATVIYTNLLPAEFAVMWSGLFNFLGVLVSSGAVAFGIISLLPSS